MCTGREDGTLADHPSTFSADGKWAASAHGIVRVWELATGKSRRATKRQFSNVAIEPVSLSAEWTVPGTSTDGTKMFVLAPRGAEDRELTGYEVVMGKKLATASVPGASNAVAEPEPWSRRSRGSWR